MNTANQSSAMLQLHFLGMMEDVNLGSTGPRSPDVQLIDRIEEAQLDGRLPLIPKEDCLVLISVSKYGIKVTDVERREVIQRHPLHTVVQIVHYTDSFMKNNIALKIGQVGRKVFDCYVFQCASEVQASAVCKSIQDMFEVLGNKTI